MRIKLFLIIFIFIAGCSGPYIPLFTGDCITNSIVAVDALRKQGYEAELKVGGYKLPNDKHFYHAWVEYKDKKTGKWVKVRTDICQGDSIGGVLWP